MSKSVRQIVKIDEELCNGCGDCVPTCAEGAIQIVDGKARLVAERYCDGLGACLGECPRGAISVESREAEEFDVAAAAEHVGVADHKHEHSHEHAHSHGGGFVCPSSRTIDRTNECDCAGSEPAVEAASELRQWPVKLYLVNPSASFFQDAHLLVAADCVPFAFGGFHSQLLRGKVLLTGCPKFDDTELYLQKLASILSNNSIKSITVAQMEVPCCSGLLRLCQEAVRASGKNVPVEVVTVDLSGGIVDEVAV